MLDKTLSIKETYSEPLERKCPCILLLIAFRELRMIIAGWKRRLLGSISSAPSM